MTPYGKFSSAWRLTDEGIELEFEAPFNACAEIVLQAAEGTQVSENGKKIAHDGKLIRGSGTWKYRYAPNGASIDRRVPIDTMPDI